MTFLLAEQNTNMALRYADYGYILENGRIVMDGAAAMLRENEDVKEFYLGTGGRRRRAQELSRRQELQAPQALARVRGEIRMARADAEALRSLLPVLRQLREIKGVKETQPGVFYARRDAFIQFHDEGGVLHADLKKPGGSRLRSLPAGDRLPSSASWSTKRSCARAARRRLAATCRCLLPRRADEHFDALETRSADEREAALWRALPAQIAHAIARAPAIAARLRGVDPRDGHVAGRPRRAAGAAQGRPAREPERGRCAGRVRRLRDRRLGRVAAAGRTRGARLRLARTDPRARDGTRRLLAHGDARCSPPAFAPATSSTTASATTSLRPAR